MNLIKSSLVLAALLIPAVSFAEGSVVRQKLAGIARDLASGYRNSSPAGTNPSLAIFTFNTSAELQKKRIGFAVAETLSHELAKTGDFKLVERAELNRVFDELRLNLSGATDPQTALKAGKLASADTLLLGSVERTAGLYQVNARLVRAETGDVLATAYAELPAAAFDSEARDYVVLVPRTQTIGVYFIYTRRAVSARAVQTETISSCGSSGCITTLTSKDAAFWAPGIGLHYTPVEKWSFDAAFLSSAANDKTGTIDINATGSGTSRINYDQKYSMVRLLAGRDLAIGEKASLYLAAGGTAVQLSGEGDANYLTPTLYARADYHPQQRFSISISAGYDLKTKAGRGSDYAPSSFKVSELQNFYVEPAVAIHF